MRLMTVAFSVAIMFPNIAMSDDVVLPDISTDEGLLARLLISESRAPAHPEYDADAAKKGMEAMKAAIDNRLHNDPGKFGAAGAKTYADIVTAPGQFDGFPKGTSGKVSISKPVQDRIDEVLKKANTGPPGKYAKFVQNAVDTAKAAVNDPFKNVRQVGGIKAKGGGYGWRTAGSSSPGGFFVLIPEDKGELIAGNQFYTIKK